MPAYEADPVMDEKITAVIDDANHDEDMVEMLEKGERLVPRGVYRHYRNRHLYYVLGYALDSTNKSSIHGSTLVIYTRIDPDAITTSLTNLKMYSREIDEFCEMVESNTNAEPVRRFAFVDLQQHNTELLEEVRALRKKVKK